MSKDTITVNMNVHDIPIVIEALEKANEEIERLNNIINRIESIYSSLCFSAPENHYIFIEELGEVLQELKGDEKSE